MNDDDDLTRHGADRHDGPASLSPYPTSRLAPPHDLVDVAREIERADALIASVTTDKLRLLAEQIRALQDRARHILAAAHRDAELHRASCAFQKRPGRIYHLYRRNDGTRYFSMLSPADWSQKPPDPFEGSYRLEVDMSWTPEDQLDVREPRKLGDGER
jgi:hypothetical protein